MIIKGVINNGIKCQINYHLHSLEIIITKNGTENGTTIGIKIFINPLKSSKKCSILYRILVPPV
jgi:hypothetical protein